MIPNMLFISGAEIFVVIFFVLLFFGSKAIPDVARTLGKGMREFKKATEEIKREIDASSGGIKKDFEDIKSTITKETQSISSSINKEADSIAQNVNKTLDEKQP